MSKQSQRNERFLARLKARNPEAGARYEKMIEGPLRRRSRAGWSSSRRARRSSRPAERDPSSHRVDRLIVESKDVAHYDHQAFVIDWDRSNKVTASQHIKETIALESPGAVRPGFHRVPLSKWLSEE